jgi:HPt (histidine-containing phosphotransfer) domain-containing protein
MKPTAQSDSRTDAALSQAIDGLWERFLPDIRERVTVLEAAAKAVVGRKLSAKQREAAQAAAHKLAGVLGTFGLMRGTVLARELERTFARESSLGPDASAKLAAITAELQSIVETRKPSI